MVIKMPVAHSSASSTSLHPLITRELYMSSDPSQSQVKRENLLPLISVRIFFKAEYLGSPQYVLGPSLGLAFDLCRLANQVDSSCNELRRRTNSLSDGLIGVPGFRSLLCKCGCPVQQSSILSQIHLQTCRSCRPFSYTFPSFYN